MQIIADLLNTIPAINSAAMSRAQRHVDGLFKPVGSLGKLEALAIQLAGMPGGMAYRMWAKKRYWLCVPITASGRKGSLFLQKK